MHLFDQVAQAKGEYFVDNPILGRIKIEGPEAVSDVILGAESRLVLQDDVVEFIYDCVHNDTQLLASSVDLVKLPARATWLEWREQNGHQSPSARIGVLIVGEEGERRGRCHIIFERDNLGPELAQLIIEFDFDDPPSIENRAGQYGMNHENEEMDRLLKYFRVCVTPSWLRHLIALRGHAGLTNAVAEHLNRVWLVGPFAVALSLMLMARAPLNLRSESRASLNVKRAKKSLPALLDHTVVTTRLFSDTAPNGSADSGPRRTTRLHHVRGHLVRRSGKIFWRKPHLRGFGSGTELYVPMRRVSL